MPGSDLRRAVYRGRTRPKWTVLRTCRSAARFCSHVDPPRSSLSELPRRSAYPFFSAVFPDKLAVRETDEARRHSHILTWRLGSLATPPL
jgi:hypothetical protein